MSTREIAETMASCRDKDDYELLYMSNTNQPLIGLINSGNWFAQLVFYPNRAVLPTDGLVDGQPCFYYHLDDFANCNALAAPRGSRLLNFQRPWISKFPFDLREGARYLGQRWVGG